MKVQKSDAMKISLLFLLCVSVQASLVRELIPVWKCLVCLPSFRVYKTACLRRGLPKVITNKSISIETMGASTVIARWNPIRAKAIRETDKLCCTSCCRTLIYKAELRCTAALEAELRQQQSCAHSSTLHREVRPKAQVCK